MRAIRKANRGPFIEFAHLADLDANLRLLRNAFSNCLLELTAYLQDEQANAPREEPPTVFHTANNANQNSQQYHTAVNVTPQTQQNNTALNATHRTQGNMENQNQRQFYGENFFLRIFQISIRMH